MHDIQAKTSPAQYYAPCGWNTGLVLQRKHLKACTIIVPEYQPRTVSGHLDSNASIAGAQVLPCLNEIETALKAGNADNNGERSCREARKNRGLNRSRHKPLCRTASNGLSQSAEISLQFPAIRCRIPGPDKVRCHHQRHAHHRPADKEYTVSILSQLSFAAMLLSIRQSRHPPETP